MSDSKRWLISTLISFTLLLVLVGQWMIMNQYHIETSQLESEEEALNYLEENWGARLEQQGMALEDTLLVKTGIFVQSLQFFNSNDVNLTGYLWQIYEDGVHDDIKPEPGEAG
ncbi:MAG: hypothetical protein MI746_13020, partial [Pseudomonadales bacterium]|nr:hypothetical protein [Pseudomonadales bacterium]